MRRMSQECGRHLKPGQRGTAKGSDPLVAPGLGHHPFHGIVTILGMVLPANRSSFGSMTTTDILQQNRITSLCPESRLVLYLISAVHAALTMSEFRQGRASPLAVMEKFSKTHERGHRLGVGLVISASVLKAFVAIQYRGIIVSIVITMSGMKRAVRL